MTRPIYVLFLMLQVLAFAIHTGHGRTLPPSTTSQTTTTPSGMDNTKYQRCTNIVNRIYLFLDTDGNGVVEDEEVRHSDLSALGLTEHDRIELIEGCYFITQMTTEDINLYFDRCARMTQYLAHVSLLDGQDIFERFMDPSSDSLMDQMLISKADRDQLRRKLFKSILAANGPKILKRNKYLMHQGGLVPTITDIRTTSLSVRLPIVDEAHGYKVQYCEVDGGKSSTSNLIDVCGFAWSAVYPTVGVHLVSLYGLKPSSQYQIRVRVFFCDGGASVVGKTMTIKTKHKPKSLWSQKTTTNKQVGGDAGNVGNAGGVVHVPNPTIKRISASRDTILLSWGGGCLIDANAMRAVKQTSNVSTSDEICLTGEGFKESRTSDGADEADGEDVRGAEPITWEVKYDRDEGMGWKGSWQTAGCVEARRVDNMNDDPFSCFVNGLKEGRRYKFAVFGKSKRKNSSMEIISKISRHMTACDDDDDCYGEKICSPSYKCVSPNFSKTIAMWIISFLLLISILGYVWVRSYVTINSTEDIMESIDKRHPCMTVSFDGIVKGVEGEKIPVKNLSDEKRKKWKSKKPNKKLNGKSENDIFAFEKFQYSYCMTISCSGGGNTKKSSFMCERYVGGGSFGRVFLLRPVDTTSPKYKNKALKSCRDEKFTNGRCMAIKFLEQGTNAMEVEMIRKNLDYHENVSRPRFWLNTGFTSGLFRQSAPQNCFLIMPYLPLGSLDMFLPYYRPDRKSVPPRVCRRLAHQALKGLYHLHSHGYIHLDIKPGNMMLSSEGILKLVDFGEMAYIQPNNSNGVDGIVHKGWDDPRTTCMYAAPELATPFAPSDGAPTYTYKDPQGKRFYYCERAGHYDTCGFNHKVDIYALGITLLNLARGYYYLVDSPENLGRLGCAKTLGTYTTRTISGIDLDLLCEDIPQSYRLKGRSDFVLFIKKMVCNVNERLSAKTLLSQPPGKTWLRIDSKNDERVASTNIRGASGASGASGTSGSRKKKFIAQKSDDGISLRKLTNDSTFQPDATLEELCQFLVEHDKTIPEVNKYNTTRLQKGETKRLSFVEKALLLFPSDDVPVVPLQLSAQGNSALGYELKTVNECKGLMVKYLKLNQLKEEKLKLLLSKLNVENIQEFFVQAWNPPSTERSDAVPMTDREKEEATDLIGIMCHYCKVNLIHHVASLNITIVLSLVMKYYSYKTNIHRKKSCKKIIDQFQCQLQKEFYIVWNRNLITGAALSSTHDGRRSPTIKGERMKGDVEMRALWYPDNKSGWLWVRVGNTSSNSTERCGSLKTTSSLLNMRSRSTRNSFDVGNSHGGADDDGSSSSSSMVKGVSEDNMTWKKMYVTMDTGTGCVQCYANIVDSVTDSNEPLEEILIDDTVEYHFVDGSTANTVRTAMSTKSTLFNAELGLCTTDVATSNNEEKDNHVTSRHGSGRDGGDTKADLSCLLLPQMHACVIIKKNDDVVLFGIEKKKECKTSKRFKKNTWLDNFVQKSSKKESSSKDGLVQNEGKWSGNATFDQQRNYNPSGKYSEQGPLGHRTFNDSLSLMTTIRITLPPMSELTTMQQSWLNADVSRAGGSHETNAAMQRQSDKIDDKHYRLCSIYVQYDEEHQHYTIEHEEHPMWSVFLSKKAKQMNFTLKELKKTWDKDHKHSLESKLRKGKLSLSSLSDSPRHKKWRKAAKRATAFRPQNGLLRGSSSVSLPLSANSRSSSTSSISTMASKGGAGSPTAACTGNSTAAARVSTKNNASGGTMTTGVISTTPLRSISNSSEASSVDGLIRPHDEDELYAADGSSSSAAVLQLVQEIKDIKKDLNNFKEHLMGPLKEDVDEQFADIAERLALLERKSTTVGGRDGDGDGDGGSTKVLARSVARSEPKKKTTTTSPLPATRKERIRRLSQRGIKSPSV